MGIRETINTRRASGEWKHPVSPTYWGAYCMDGLAMALHACYNTNNVADAVNYAANLLGDADSTASMAGQIAGAFYGYTGIQTCKQDSSGNFGGQLLINEMNRHCDSDIPYRAVLLYYVSDQYFRSDDAQQTFRAWRRGDPAPLGETTVKPEAASQVQQQATPPVMTPKQK